MEIIKAINEKTIAVGNMQVNARGDEIDPNNGQVVRDSSQRVADYYRIHNARPAKVVPEPVKPVTPKQEPAKVEKKKEIANDQSERNG